MYVVCAQCFYDRRPVHSMERAHCGLFSFVIAYHLGTIGIAYTKIDLFISHACYSCSSPFSCCAKQCANNTPTQCFHLNFCAYYSTQSTNNHSNNNETKSHTKHDQINGTCAIASNNRSWPLIQTQPNIGWWCRNGKLNKTTQNRQRIDQNQREKKKNLVANSKSTMSIKKTHTHTRENRAAANPK